MISYETRGRDDIEVLVHESECGVRNEIFLQEDDIIALIHVVHKVLTDEPIPDGVEGGYLNIESAEKDDGSYLLTVTDKAVRTTLTLDESDMEGIIHPKKDRLKHETIEMF